MDTACQSQYQWIGHLDLRLIDGIAATLPTSGKRRRRGDPGLLCA
ncbi:MAG: hypothetical protein ACRD29_03315 [Acidimicrobiales bacterium]